MPLFFKILAVVFCIPLFALGMRAMFTPGSIGEAMSIEPHGALGESTIRSVIGGMFISCVAMLSIGVATTQTLWFVAVAIVMCAIIIGRIIGLALDGIDKGVIPPLIIELIIAGGLFAAHFSAST